MARKSMSACLLGLGTGPVAQRTLHLPSSHLSGADLVKLHDQMARFGSSVVGMPPVLAYRGSDGAILIYDGGTRATRVEQFGSR